MFQYKKIFILYNNPYKGKCHYYFYKKDFSVVCSCFYNKLNISKSCHVKQTSKVQHRKMHFETTEIFDRDVVFDK